MASQIPKDKVIEIVKENGEAIISDIVTGLVKSGFKYPIQVPNKEGDPFILDLEATLKEMVDEGILEKNDETDKYAYTMPSV